MTVLSRHNVEWPEYLAVKKFYSKQNQDETSNVKRHQQYTQNNPTQHPLTSPTNQVISVDPIKISQ